MSRWILFLFQFVKMGFITVGMYKYRMICAYLLTYLAVPEVVHPRVHPLHVVHPGVHPLHVIHPRVHPMNHPSHPGVHHIGVNHPIHPSHSVHSINILIHPISMHRVPVHPHHALHP